MKHIADRICKSCGVTFQGGPRAWYCLTCRAERRKMYDREHKRRKKLGLSRKVGELQTCIDCGNQYAFYVGASERCPECAEKRGKMIDRQKSKEWNLENKSRYLGAKKEFELRKYQNSEAIKTGQKYVTFDRRKGRYRVVVKGVHVGYFGDLESAVAARDAALSKI